MGRKPVLLVDDECVFCNKTVNFIIRNGGEGKFKFLSLYSDEGTKMLKKFGLPGDYKKSVVLIENDTVYLKSEAVLKIAARFEGVARILSLAKVLPVGFRDRIYDLIAKHRHKIV